MLTHSLALGGSRSAVRWQPRCACPALRSRSYYSVSLPRCICGRSPRSAVTTTLPESLRRAARRARISCHWTSDGASNIGQSHSVCTDPHGATLDPLHQLDLCFQRHTNTLEQRLYLLARRAFLMQRTSDRAAMSGTSRVMGTYRATNVVRIRATPRSEPPLQGEAEKVTVALTWE